jgi:hypothetical protein
MYANKDFPPASPNESYTLTFNFNKDIKVGETIVSSLWTLTAVVGQDADAASRLVGAPSVVGPKVSQRVTGLLAGVKYRLECVATTSNVPANKYELYSHVQCYAPDVPIDQGSRGELQARLDDINEAIASGVGTIAYDGKSVGYRSLEELRQIRHDLEGQLGGGKVKRTFRVKSNRGY